MQLSPHGSEDPALIYHWSEEISFIDLKATFFIFLPAKALTESREITSEVNMPNKVGKVIPLPANDILILSLVGLL